MTKLGDHMQQAAQRNLEPPVLPQMQNGRIDMTSDAVRTAGGLLVAIPEYAEMDVGDRISVFFDPGGDTGKRVSRFFYFRPGADKQSLVVNLSPLWVIPDGKSEVSYMVTSSTGNPATSPSRTVEIVNAVTPPGAVVQTALYGLYQPGRLASWVLPGNYPLPAANLVMATSLGKSDKGVTIGIYLTKGQTAKRFALLGYDSDKDVWVCKLDGAALQSSAGDLLELRLEGSANMHIYVAVSM